ncbi:MAG: hypothetical protein SNJ58_09455 [Aggregatilineales bacterium]
MPYYPETTVVLGSTRIIRQYRLPPNAIGRVEVNDGSTVAPDTVLLAGTIPSEVIFLDAVKLLGLRSADQITEEMLQVPVGEVYESGVPLLVNGRGRRAKKVITPKRARFAHFEAGRVLLQTDPQPVAVYALMEGRVNSTSEGRVVLETGGALIQAAWGNGGASYGALAFAKEESTLERLGLEDEEDSGQIVVLDESIQSAAIFKEAAQKRWRGLIAPSMSSALRDQARRLGIPLILTEGFGNLPYSDIVYNLLENNRGRFTTVDAVEPSVWRSERPEIVIPTGPSSRLRLPEVNLPLVAGATIRVTRLPYMGRIAKVLNLPESPVTMENGLRVAAAEVQFSDNSEIAFVPLANVELIGRPLDAPSRPQS